MAHYRSEIARKITKQSCKWDIVSIVIPQIHFLTLVYLSNLFKNEFRFLHQTIEELQEFLTPKLMIKEWIRLDKNSALIWQISYVLRHMWFMFFHHPCLDGFPFLEDLRDYQKYMQWSSQTACKSSRKSFFCIAVQSKSESD